MNIPQISQMTPVGGNQRNVTSPPDTPSHRELQSSKGRDQSLPVMALATHTNRDSEWGSEGNKLHKTAEDGRAQFGDQAADFLNRNFYVDNGLTSVPTVPEAIKLIKDSQALCTSAKLRLHKFTSNCKDVLEALPKDDWAKDLKDLDLRHDTLLIQWSLGTFTCIESDMLGFCIKLKDKLLSCRGILLMISPVYDPLGIVSSVILSGKLILQDLGTPALPTL